MIDSAVLVWGVATPAGAVDDGNRPPAAARRRAARLRESPPVYLNWPELLERHGSDKGQVRRIVYGDREMTAGHWQPGDFEMLYTEGRVELRASLPKILTGRNDAMLDEAGVHDALHELVRLGREATGAKLELAAAVPSRLDFFYDWRDTASVGFVLEHIKSSFSPARKGMTEWQTPRGGHSLVWGYGGKRVIRFYDKGAELTEQAIKSREITWTKGHRLNCRCEKCGPAPYPIDTLLRFEIQERRRGPLRLIHERGYRAADVMHELQRTIGVLGDVVLHDLREIASTRPPITVGVFIRSQWLRENTGAWPILKEHLPAMTYYRWRRQARENVLGSAYWTPTIPPDAFDSAGASVWSERAAA